MIKNLAILFWFYKEPKICRNHLEVLKKHNPNLKIYGLYGGKIKEAEKYKQALGKYLDDFYITPKHDDYWKWINGDLMLLDWYEKRGKKLKWDSLAIYQWDLLVFDSLLKIFKKMNNGQIFLSGLRKVDKEVYDNWDWTKNWTKKSKAGRRKNFQDFVDYIKNSYKFKGLPLCCLFIFEIFPKIFFRKYSAVKNKQLGMLEYKIPCYAKIFKIPFFRKDFKVFWNLYNEDIKDSPLNAIPKKISKRYINKELKSKSGFRLFHPYFKLWDNK